MRRLFKSLFAFVLLMVVLIVQVPSSFAYTTQQTIAQVDLKDTSVQHLDITTVEGRKQAFAQIGIGELLFPELWLLDWLWNNFSPGNVEAREIEAQRRSAIEIIRAGKDSNVDELDITMSEKAGIGLNANVEGVPVEFIVGNSGNMTVKVKYKT